MLGRSIRPYLVAPCSMCAGSVGLFWVICLTALSRGQNNSVYIFNFHGANFAEYTSAAYPHIFIAYHHTGSDALLFVRILVSWAILSCSRLC